jgi:hypothetical protein
MTKTKRARYWVLRDREFCFEKWTAIGPRCTKTRGKAERFPSKTKAMQSEAYRFPLMSFEPKAVR